MLFNIISLYNKDSMPCLLRSEIFLACSWESCVRCYDTRYLWQSRAVLCWLVVWSQNILMIFQILLMVFNGNGSYTSIMISGMIMLMLGCGGAQWWSPACDVMTPHQTTPDICHMSLLILYWGTYKSQLYIYKPFC